MNARCKVYEPGTVDTKNPDQTGRCDLPAGHDGAHQTHVRLIWHDEVLER